VDGTLAELVAAIPYLLVFGRIPPRRVLDTIFRAGIVDAGMSGGCRWAPFEIGDAEYEELATALVGAGHRRVDCPDWVESPGDWTVWLLGEVRGVPVEAHRELAAEEARRARQLEEARARGDAAAVLELHLAHVEAGQRLADFLMGHLGDGGRRA
jgi:hypothetical protein